MPDTPKIKLYECPRCHTDGLAEPRPGVPPCCPSCTGRTVVYDEVKR